MNFISCQVSTIMRASTCWLLFSLAVTGAGAASAAPAESPAAKAPPPDLQKLEEGSPIDGPARAPEQYESK